MNGRASRGHVHELHNPLHCILPPHILDRLAESEDAVLRRTAQDAMVLSAEARTTRRLLATMPMMAAIPSPEGKKNRLVYDAQNKPFSSLPGKLIRKEGDKAVADPAVNEAYDNAGTTYDFYYKVFSRNSLDGRGMSLISSVHLMKNLNNAFWTGEQMAYGDGDGRIFIRFTKSLDVVGHELTHGVVTHTSNLEYQGESGALNESFADVFGSLVKQWKRKHPVTKADWKIGPDIMGPGVKAKCLRTLTADKAYTNDPILGTDPQPKHMKDKFTGSDDHGGVHINSGIPNHAFYRLAMALGGNAWEKAGAIWYKALVALTTTSNFQDAAAATAQAAGALYGSNGAEEKAVKDAWKAVGL